MAAPTASTVVCRAAKVPSTRSLRGAVTFRPDRPRSSAMASNSSASSTDSRVYRAFSPCRSNRAWNRGALRLARMGRPATAKQGSGALEMLMGVLVSVLDAPLGIKRESPGPRTPGDGRPGMFPIRSTVRAPAPKRPSPTR